MTPAWAGRLLFLLEELILPAVLILIWWKASASSTSLYFPPLSDILSAFYETWIADGLSPVLGSTLRTFALGYGIALILGVLLGLLLAAKQAVAEFFNPLLEFLRALPGVALVPVFMSVLGVGTQMRVSIVVFASIWPILLNTVDGVRGLDMVARETTSSFHVPFWQRLFNFTLPGAAPQIMAGARVGLALSLIAVIVTEMVTPSDGVGSFARTAQMSFDLNSMWTALILMGLVGYLLNLTYLLVEKRILRWHIRMHSSAGL